jgi:hypothetical protein
MEGLGHRVGRVDGTVAGIVVGIVVARGGTPLPSMTLATTFFANDRIIGPM